MGIPRRRKCRGYCNHLQSASKSTNKTQLPWKLIWRKKVTQEPNLTEYGFNTDDPPTLNVSDTFNVLMIVIDSVSRFIAETAWKKVSKYLEEELGAITFKHHYSLAHYSMANADGFLTGYVVFIPISKRGKCNLSLILVYR
jgi:hypothetical protein